MTVTGASVNRRRTARPRRARLIIAKAYSRTGLPMAGRDPPSAVARPRRRTGTCAGCCAVTAYRGVGSHPPDGTVASDPAATVQDVRVPHRHGSRDGAPPRYGSTGLPNAHGASASGGDAVVQHAICVRTAKYSVSRTIALPCTSTTLTPEPGSPAAPRPVTACCDEVDHWIACRAPPGYSVL